MRQIGFVTNAVWAERFTAFLITQGIAAQAEEEGDVWAIWVRDEDQLDEAKTALEQFTESDVAARDPFDRPLAK